MARGTDTPKDRDEVNKREVSECDGCVCDLDVIGVIYVACKRETSRRFSLLHVFLDQEI